MYCRKVHAQGMFCGYLGVPHRTHNPKIPVDEGSNCPSSCCGIGEDKVERSRQANVDEQASIKTFIGTDAESGISSDGGDIDVHKG